MAASGGRRSVVTRSVSRSRSRRRRTVVTGRRSITRSVSRNLRIYYVGSRRELDTKGLLLWPIVPHPLSVEPKHVPEPFSNNRKPNEILEAKLEEGKKMKFLIKWNAAPDHVCSRCTTIVELVCAKTARFICPTLVIGFYQSRIEWGAAQERAEGDPECIDALIEKHQLKKLTVKL